MNKMKTAVLVGPKRFEIQEIPIPEVKETEVLVRIKATAICGTEVAVYTGEHKVDYPLIMGHETAGVVAKRGTGVTSVKESDPVFIISGISCGFCEYCRGGKDNLCLNGGLLGREMPGSYAEYVTVPEWAVFKLPADFSVVQATTLNLVMTVIHGHRKLKIFPGQSVAIIGLGPAGLVHAYFAKVSGAGPIIGLGHQAWNEDIAKCFGIDRFILTKEENSTDKIYKVLGEDGVDVVINAAGRASALKQAIKLVRPGGRILQFGIAGQIDNINFYILYFKEADILSSRATVAEDFLPAVKLFQNNKVLLSRLVTHTLPLEKIQEGFEMMQDRKKEGVLRIVIIY